MDVGCERKMYSMKLKDEFKIFVCGERGLYRPKDTRPTVLQLMNELNHCKLTIRDKLGEKSDSNLFCPRAISVLSFFLFDNPHAPLSKNEN